MISILFVCHGNICRSPMAEYIFKNLVTYDKNYKISSCGTSNEEMGNDMFHEAKDILIKYDVPFKKREARTLTKYDYENYDFIIGMDSVNIKNIYRIIGSDPLNKVHKLLDFTDNSHDIEDPWYTGNFDLVYQQILEGCYKLLDYLNNQ